MQPWTYQIQISSAYPRWTIRFRHEWLQARRLPHVLPSVRPTGRQNDQGGHRSTSQRIGQRESCYRLLQQRLPHSGCDHPMLNAERPPGRGDRNRMSRVLSVFELNYTLPCAWNKGMLYSKKSVLLTSTYKSMHEHIIQSRVTSLTTDNSTHNYTSTVLACNSKCYNVRKIYYNTIQYNIRLLWLDRTQANNTGNANVWCVYWQYSANIYRYLMFNKSNVCTNSAQEQRPNESKNAPRQSLTRIDSLIDCAMISVPANTV